LLTTTSISGESWFRRYELGQPDGCRDTDNGHSICSPRNIFGEHKNRYGLILNSSYTDEYYSVANSV
jgi:hypothetical protein